MTTDEPAGAPQHTVLVVHGRGFKPSADTYLELAVAAIRAGVQRDFTDVASVFDAAHIAHAHYGDLSASVLQGGGKSFDETLDVGDRRHALAALGEIRVRSKFGIGQYDRLPGKSAVREAVVNFLAPILGALGLCVPMIRAASKDFAAYFHRNSDYRDEVRRRLRERLCELLDRDSRVALISHGTGSVIAYDVLWQLSHDQNFKAQYGGKKVELWMTLGSPLGDASIRRRLLGRKDVGRGSYPENVIVWHNVAAEDDYTCHDNTLADDFKPMLKQRKISAIYDHKIYNLAVRYGRSNPHSSIGYYIHPRVSKILSDWLRPLV